MSATQTISVQPRLPAAKRRWAIADSPRLERAISIISDNVPAAVAGRFQTALETILGWTLESEWAEVMWSFSLLIGDCFPIEFTLSSADSGISYAAEVAGPEVPDGERLSRAFAVLQRLGQPPPQREVVDLLRRIQASGALSFGAWIGARHHVDGDRYKVYVEVPRSHWHTAQSEFGHLLGTEPLLNHRSTQLQIISYDPRKHRTEFYFEVQGLERWELERLLNRAGLSGRSEELLTLLEETFGYSIGETLPTVNLGFSYSFGAGAEPTVFSVFAISRCALGSDERIRRQLLSLGVRKGWDLGLYEKLSAPIAARGGRRTRHSLLSFVVPPAGPLSIRIGMSPPVGSCDDE